VFFYFFYFFFLHLRSPKLTIWQGQPIYFFLNHPVRWVRLVGAVVSFEEFEEQGRVLIHRMTPRLSVLFIFCSCNCAKTTSTVDDGSGDTIQLVYFKQDPNRQSTGHFVRPGGDQNIDFRGIRLHSVVKAKGEISEFRDSRQITLRKIGM